MGLRLERYDDIIKEVHKYRQFWKPKKVRILLLAESHVFTLPEEYAHILKTEKINYLLAKSKYGSHYVRFVYCLGYGENDLLNSHVDNNDEGTWQFWKLFYSCVEKVQSDSDFAILKRQTTDFQKRMDCKIKLLEKMRKRGIWLLDASIVGINKMKQKDRNLVIQYCWKNYIRDIISQCAPAFILCIGKSVWRELEHDLKDLMGNENVDWIPQPQARLSRMNPPWTSQKIFKQCFSVCQRFQ